MRVLIFWSETLIRLLSDEELLNHLAVKSSLHVDACLLRIIRALHHTLLWCFSTDPDNH